jgi:hypothetical protein
MKNNSTARSIRKSNVIRQIGSWGTTNVKLDMTRKKGMWQRRGRKGRLGRVISEGCEP